MPSNSEESKTTGEGASFQRSPSYYATLVRDCKDLVAGKVIHGHILKAGLHRNVFLTNLLIHLYGHLGDLGQAEALFNQTLRRDQFTWNNMMGAYLSHGLPLHTRLLFTQMEEQQQGVPPDTCSFVNALAACTKEPAPLQAYHIHVLAVSYGFDTDTRVGTALLEFYRKHGCLEEVRKTFYNILEPDAFSWTAIIAAHAKYGQGQIAFLLFEQMQLQCVLPDKAIFASTLSSFDCSNLLVEGRRLHARICGSGYQKDVIVGTSLINMYGKCNCISAAQSMFGTMLKRDTISWNSMLAVYIKHGLSKDAIQFYEEMLQLGVQPDTTTFITLLDVFSSEPSLAEGKKVHKHIIARGFESDIRVSTSLLNMYARCSSLVQARAMFDKMSNCDVVSWNAMIDACCQHEQGKEALDLFERMQQGNVVADKFTLSSVIQACAFEAALQEGRQLHNKVVDNGWESDVVVGTSLVTMYARCFNLEDALTIFNKLAERNLVSWNAMIGAYACHGQAFQAIRLFEQMQQVGEMPNKVTYVSILSVYDSKSFLTEGKYMHARLINDEFNSGTTIGNALLSMYNKCGNVVDARAFFDEMLEWDVISWTVMMSSYAQQGFYKDSRLLFQQMQRRGVMLDKTFLIVMISAFTSPDALQEGKAMHAHIANIRLNSNVDVANAFIGMYGKCGSLEDALKTFYKVPTKDNQTYTVALSVCANETALSDGKHIHHHMAEHGVEIGLTLGNAVINMYGKCGCIEDAHITFLNMPNRDTVSWSTMISIYAQHGQGEAALALLDQMHHGGVSPTSVTFLSILSGCNHAGLVDEGCQHFASMHEDHGIVPSQDHFNCIVDLLARSGRLEEAERTILRMPCNERGVSWITLLRACGHHDDVERGERAARNAMEVDPRNSLPYVMLANLYASIGKKEDATNVIISMEEKGLTMEDYMLLKM